MKVPGKRMGIHQEYHLIHLENVHVTSHDVVLQSVLLLHPPLQ